LQSPRRAIAGFAQILQQDYQSQLDEKADDRIVDGCQRMQTMIDDMLTYSRVESRLWPFEPTDLGEVFDDVVTLLRADIEDAGGEVTRGELPTVRGDRSQLSQLLKNLVSNGLKYHGDGPPRVQISADQNGSE
jgi:light-regulated signal transduction histidine kinase (bacteriophytochrome)